MFAALFQLTFKALFHLRGALAIIFMSIAVAAVYWLSPMTHSLLIGSDYIRLHMRRMQFARDALFSSEHFLSAWYPRELLGTPFWSNIQNFPFIPTRLLVLLTMDPGGPRAYSTAITLSAVLAALFTYLYLRKIGLGRFSSSAAGWTFASSGYYASRVMVGHLPLLEAYPALPLLLWVIESNLQAQERGEPSRPWIGALSLSSTCVMLAGHPQLPVYAMTAAGIYALWRGGVRRALSAWTAMTLGVGIAGFVLVPMAMLVGRSTRLLALAPPSNDLAMPYGRLLAFFFPWRDGAPPRLRGYPDEVFWDTVSYIGLLPWIAALLLVCFAALLKVEKPARRIALFMLALGLAGIGLALPFVHHGMFSIPGTFLRSPARIIYLTEFVLAVALGAGMHAAFGAVRTRIGRMVLALLLAIHAIDLAEHDRRFIMPTSLSVPLAEYERITKILSQVGDARVAMDYQLELAMNRTVDDIGFFDSIMLARSYRTILNLGGLPSDLNVQVFNGSETSSRALAAMGVKFVITDAERADLSSEGEVGEIKIYRVPVPSRRAEFFDGHNIRFLTPEQMDFALRDPNFDLASVLLLSGENAVAGREIVAEKKSDDHVTVDYRRPNSDQIEITVTTGRSGYLRVIESWDPGWSATVNKLPAPIVPAMGALLAVPVNPGRNEVRFVYSTPGATLGQAVSIISLVLLFCFIWMFSRKQHLQQS